MKILLLLLILFSCGRRQIKTLDDLEGERLILNKVCTLALDHLQENKYLAFFQCRADYNVDTLTFEGVELTCTQYNTDFLDRFVITEERTEARCVVDYLNNRVVYTFDALDMEELLVGTTRRGINRGFEIENEEGKIEKLDDWQLEKNR